MEEKKDTRGYDLRIDNFQTQLNLLINESHLLPSMLVYILKDTLREIEMIYKQAVDLQYKQFCEEANKELEETKEENKKDETE